MKKYIFDSHLLLYALVAIVMSACNNNNNTAETDKSSNQALNQLPDSVIKHEMSVDEMIQGDMVFKDTVSPEFKSKFQKVVNAYLSMKQGMVNDNWKEVDQQATQMRTLLNDIPDNTLSGEAQLFWKEKKAFLQEHLALYREAENEAAKRKNFVFLSSALIKSVKAFGAGNQKLYVSYCPMANDNRGAYWLSQTKQIQNPYMGQKMPNCGEVKEEL